MMQYKPYRLVQSLTKLENKSANSWLDEMKSRVDREVCVLGIC